MPDAFCARLETAALPLLFDSQFLSKLEQLYLLSKKLFRGEHRAERKSRHTGSSLEFADYRNYTLGDDPRTVDWNIYGRLDRLFVKLFEQEQDLHIYFLIDASASMRWMPEGAATTSKLAVACRVCASLAYIGLSNLDRVNVHWFGPELGQDLGLSRGKSQFHNVLDFLRRPPALEGTTRLLPSFRAFAHRMKRRGLVFVISDLFDPAGYEEALDLLRYHQFQLNVIQILESSEIDPRMSGDLRLIDTETAIPFEVTADEGLLRRYRATFKEFVESLAAFCLRRNIGFGQATTAMPFEDVVLRVLRDGMMMR